MGTRFELVLVAAGEDTPRARRRLRAAGAAALEVIEACDARWSLFRRDSLVARIRREAALYPVRVDEQSFALLAASLELWHATGGAFDPGLGAEMDALGFRGRPAVVSEVSVAPRPPFELDAGARTIRMTRPGALLDLGGVAKGFALDLAASELREAGIGCALLHGGTSSVVALGAPHQAGEAGSGNALPGWRVAIEVSPGPADSECLVARLVDASLSVSAPRGRTSSAGGHVLDPRCGRPAARVRTACVVADSGLVADALATALVAAAPSGRELSLPPRTAAALAGPGAPGWTRMGASEGVFENGGPVSPHLR